MSRKKKTAEDVSRRNIQPIPVGDQPEATELTEAEIQAQTNLTPAVMCPVVSGEWSCDAILVLQPHPTLPGRVIAVCNCTSAWSGQCVYETNAPATGDVEPELKEEAADDSA
jgi:hypothetical protein